MGGVDQFLDLEPDSVLGTGHTGDALLHQGAAEIVHTPVERFSRSRQAHFHPARLEVRDRLAEREAEGRGVLEVLVDRDLLHPVSSPEQRVERNEAQRHEFGDAAGAALKVTDHLHVTGKFARFLDVTEHHRRGRLQPGPV